MEDVNSGGSSLRIALMVSAGVAPWKARLPDSISYTMAPRAKMSERASTACPRTCSGDMYPAVPITRPGSVADMAFLVSVLSGSG